MVDSWQVCLIGHIWFQSSGSRIESGPKSRPIYAVGRVSGYCQTSTVVHLDAKSEKRGGGGGGGVAVKIFVSI